MPISNPFNVDAGLASERELALLPPHGGSEIAAFCGTDQPSRDWDERELCVLKGRRGFGKSHLLAARSANHRASGAAPRTIFYPQGGRPRILFEVLSNLHAAVPRWLQGRESTAAWIYLWQLAILGLLVWVTRARSDALPAYAQWFGSLDALDQLHREQQGDGADAGQPDAMLTWFIGRVLANLPRDDYNAGVAALQQALFHANADWAVAIKASIEASGKRRIAMYLDAPDELVELNPPNLWRNVQQGLLLAIWKFSKTSTWGRLLNIYATVRSEAFGSGHDHPDIGLAMGLVLSLRYTRDQLAAMLDDRIRAADPSRLAMQLGEASSPLEALCGFGRIVHDDRKTVTGERFIESVFDGIVRHTRLVPREVVAIGGAIYGITGRRSAEIVRMAINAQASQNMGYAIAHSILGWSDTQHRRLALMLHDEVIDGASLAALAASFDVEGASIVKLFIQHGLLGIAEPMPDRHRNCYQQRFAFDEIHGSATSSSIAKDYYFVHPAFKEWIRSQPDYEPPLQRQSLGLIGDLLPFESAPPLIRLSVSSGRAVIGLRPTAARLEASNRGANSDPLKFLFVLLWACREKGRERISITEFKELLERLKAVESLRLAVRIAFDGRLQAMAEKIRDWAKKINRDPQLRQLQVLFEGPHPTEESQRSGHQKRLAGRRPFISVSARSSIGAQTELLIAGLPVDQIDWDDGLRGYAMRES